MTEQIEEVPAELILTIAAIAGTKALPCGMKCTRQDKHLNLLWPPTPKS